MKCPKCGYLGFETSDRCRNCGYDFSLTMNVGPASELPLHSSDHPGGPLDDFTLSDADSRIDADAAGNLDLDRVIGSSYAHDDGSTGAETLPSQAGEDRSARHRDAASVAYDEVPERDVSAPTPFAASRSHRALDPSADPANVRPTRTARSAEGRGASSPESELPLFGDDDTPLITAPRPPRAPLSVRRTTPEIPRVRSRSVTPRPEGIDVTLPEQPSSGIDLNAGARVADAAGAIAPDTAATAGPRATAAIIDIALLGAINAAVVYLTLAMTGLTTGEWAQLPLAPMALFFAILDGGYLVTFIAASGQTIGKMVTGVRVVSDDGRRVGVSAAVARAVGCLLSLLTMGLGYLPAFVGADRRALQDRISGTRVVSAR